VLNFQVRTGLSSLEDKTNMLSQNIGYQTTSDTAIFQDKGSHNCTTAKT
jgi:hypothetical protein